jgi:endonuclease YncB( thermonuclease family)
MKTMGWTIAIAILFGLLAAGPAAAESITGKVTGISPEGLLKVQVGTDTKEIRLFGVDCVLSGQAHADELKAFLEKNVINKEVTVDVKSVDNLGKAVGLVTLPDYKNVNYTLVENGLAWWDKENAPKDATLKQLNAKAITSKTGLWKDDAPLSPADFRRSHGQTEFKYTVEEKKEKVEPKKEETKSVSAKGTAEFKGGTGRVIDAGKIKFDKQVDPAQLLMQHMPTAATDASGKPIGMAVPDIGSIPYAKDLGFQDGDIIQSVNGMPMTDLNQAMPMYEQLKNAKQVSVQVMRGGQPVTMTINIP